MDFELTEFMYPCVTYVIKRLMLDQSPKSFIKHDGWTIVQFDSKKVKEGDVVLWQNGGYESDVTLRVVNGTPVSKHIVIDNHYGVVEKNGLISDLTIDGCDYAPRIRIMHIDDCRQPNFIMKKV